MLSLKEHIELEQVNEAWYAEFDQETIDKADHFSIVFNPIVQKTVVRLLDDQYQNLGEVNFDTPELAIAFVEEHFELDDDDVDWLEGYEWADDDDAEDEYLVNEALEDIDTFIKRQADEWNVRIGNFDNDAMFDDGGFGVSVDFHRQNNDKNLKKFVDIIGLELKSTYGAITKAFDGQQWDIAL